MARLPADQRTALVMVAIQGMSYEEVAEAMGCAVGTAKCRVFRARCTLEAQLLGEEEQGRTARRRRNAGAAAFLPPNMERAAPTAAAPRHGYDGRA